MEGHREACERVDLQLFGLDQGQLIIPHCLFNQRLYQEAELFSHGAIRFHDETDKVIRDDIAQLMILEMLGFEHKTGGMERSLASLGEDGWGTRVGDANIDQKRTTASSARHDGSIGLEHAKRWSHRNVRPELLDTCGATGATSQTQDDIENSIVAVSAQFEHLLAAVMMMCLGEVVKQLGATVWAT